MVDGLRAGDHDGPAFNGVVDEHIAYVAALSAAGVAVEVLPPLEAFPDSVFVEDPALVFNQGAILLRPGAPSRAGETAELAPVLRRRFDQLLSLDRGFSDGGDVLVTPGAVLIGLSARTDAAGAQALCEALDRLDLKGRVEQTPPGVLHFKSACALLDEETVLATPAMAASGVFRGLEVVITPPGEAAAANLVRVGDSVLAPAGYPRTLELLAARGLEVVALPATEVAKIDAGLSCMSLRWRSAESKSLPVG